VRNALAYSAAALIATIKFAVQSSKAGIHKTSYEHLTIIHMVRVRYRKSDLNFSSQPFVDKGGLLTSQKVDFKS